MTGAPGWRPKLAIGLYGLAIVGLPVDIVSLSVATAAGADETFGDLLPMYGVFFCYATVGLLILLRRPGNRVGWLIGAVGFFPMVGALAEAYVRLGADWLLSDVARWYIGWYFFAAIATLPLLFLLFPDGRPASRAWRWPVLVTGIGLAAGLIRSTTGPSDMSEVVETNPYQLEALRPFFGVLEAAGIVGLLAGGLAGVASLAWRFRRSRGVERQQVKWFAAAVGVDVVLLAASAWTEQDWLSTILLEVELLLPPVAVAVAVLRYRLYDIDRLVSRTFSYAVLTGLLLGVYVLLVTGATRLLPSSSSLAVAAATLAVAALFQPLRRRVQGAVDRRFNRSRYDAEHTVEEFSRRLRDEVDLDSVRADLIAVVHDTVQPASASLWLRTGRDAP